MRQVGIFGGTFDPVHSGHLVLAQTALNHVPLEEVIWVPSLNPPHKQAADFQHRQKMVKLATNDNNGFVVWFDRVNGSGNSYAIDTLTQLSAFYPNTHWYWILGLDTFQSLPRWYRGQELSQMCDWLIAPRLPSAENIAQSELICKRVEMQLRKKSFIIRWQLMHMPLVGVSSSMIRNFCRNDESIENLVPEAVRVYMATHGLYSEKSK